MRIYAHIYQEDPEPGKDPGEILDHDGKEVYPGSQSELKRAAVSYAEEAAREAVNQDPEQDWSGWLVIVEDETEPLLYQESILKLAEAGGSKEG